MNTVGVKKKKRRQTWDYLLLNVKEGVFCLLLISILRSEVPSQGLMDVRLEVPWP